MPRKTKDSENENVEIKNETSKVTKGTKATKKTVAKKEPKAEKTVSKPSTKKSTTTKKESSTPKKETKSSAKSTKTKKSEDSTKKVAKTSSKSTSAKKSTAMEPTVEEIVPKKTSTKKATTEDSKLKKVATKKTSAKETTPKTSTTKKASTKETTSKTSATKNVSTKETTSKTSATKKTAVKEAASKTATTKKATTKKTAVKKTTTKKAVTKKNTKKVDVVEYYDLPYRYNQTIVKVLAQTPTNLFIYWDISDEDRENYKKTYGEDFFNITKPVLKIYNDTMNYSFEVEINDFANSWYLHVNDSKCDYRVELGRRPINYNKNRPFDYLNIYVSNQIESPNDKILFNKIQHMVYFRNVKTNTTTGKSIANLSFIRNMGKIYNIYDFYKEIYKDENLEEFYNPSSKFF